MLSYLPYELILSSFEESPCSCMEILMREVFQELMKIMRIILLYVETRLLTVLLFLTTTKQKQLLQPFEATNLLQRTKLVLGSYLSSKKLSVTKNNKQELEF